MPENKTIATADAIMSTVIKDVAVKAAIKIAQAELPFLALPIISNFFTFLIGKIASWLYDALENFVAFKIIDSQVGAQVSKYKESEQELRLLLACPEGATVHDLQIAKDKYKDALKNLIHYDGHA